MKDEILSRALPVRSKAAAAALADPFRRRVVLSLARQAQSVAELATTLDCELKRLHYHVDYLTRIGLLRVTGQRARAGRPIKFYQAIADTFFVPVTVIGKSSETNLTDELRALLDRHLDASRSGTLYQVSERGEFRMRPIQAPQGTGALAKEQWRVLRLSASGARSLAREMARCLKEAAATNNSSGPTYLIHFALAPRTHR